MQSYKAEVDGLSYKAHLDHLREMSKEMAERRQREERMAKLSFDRTHRDMSIAKQRRQNLEL